MPKLLVTRSNAPRDGKPFAGKWFRYFRAILLLLFSVNSESKGAGIAER